jgi:hypothetical protein
MSGGADPSGPEPAGLELAGLTITARSAEPVATRASTDDVPGQRRAVRPSSVMP